MRSSSGQQELAHGKAKGKQRAHKVRRTGLTPPGCQEMIGLGLRCHTLTARNLHLGFVLGTLVFFNVAVGYSQGLVNFINTPATLISQGPWGAGNVINAVPGSYYFALLIAAPGTTDPSSFAFTGVYATNLSLAGMISGGTDVPVNGWTPGTTKSFLIFGWPALYGATFVPGWLNAVSIIPEFGISGIGTGSAGGFDPNTGQTLPPLPIFGDAGSFGSPISAGFNIVRQCLSCDPPRIVIQPQDQWAVEGANVQFEALAGLTPQLVYQWYCNDVVISNATNFILNLNGVAVAQDGNVYYAIASNPWGTAKSSPATLHVSPSVHTVPGVRITGQPGVTLEIAMSGAINEAAGWSAWQSVVLASSREWFFDSSAFATQRFYRTVQNPGNGSSPTLELHLVPTITLTGLVGHQIQVDYLQSGATNVWLELDTVTLTNNSQYYFDTSGIDQSPRFYRLLPK